LTGQPPPRGFPESEYRRRTETAQAMMADRAIACLMVCTEPEVRYFTGFFTPFWQSPTIYSRDLNCRRIVGNRTTRNFIITIYNNFAHKVK